MTLEPIEGRIIPMPRSRAAASASSLDAADKDRFLLLLQPVKQNLYNFIHKSMNYSQDADDIFQDTLLKAFRYFYSYKPDKSFRTWVFTIAHNLLKDFFRGRRPEALEDVENIPVLLGHAVPGDVSEIYHAAAKLKPRDREIFFLFYLDEFKVSEISNITGLTQVNVKFILHRSRKAVKQMMEVKS